jgi:two-component system sensor histidine kinase DesK
MVKRQLIVPERGWVPKRDWTPLLWLVYLLSIPIEPYLRHASGLVWAENLAGVAVFLGLYFRAMQHRDRERLWLIAGMFALGTLFSAHNGGAACYFIYGAGLIGYSVKPKTAWRALAVYAVGITAAAWLLQFAIETYVVAIIFSCVLGVVGIRNAEMNRMNEHLQLAHDEVKRIAEVAERERIARDLHDVLGHTLSLIVLKSELAAKLADHDVARAAAEIRDVERIARESLGELREAVRGYRSAGLAAELDRARSVLETAGVTVDAHAEVVRLPPTHEGVLALAIREAVTNVVRHAGAHTVHIALSQDAYNCRFEIADDGRGGPAVEGNGLAGMRERIEALGGTFAHEGDAGTRLVLTLPVVKSA